MSSKHTANYQLCQWEEEDAVRRIDFNENNLKIDRVLKETANAVTAEVNARASAVASLNYSLARRGNCSVQTSAYVGDGNTVKTLSFTSMPKFVVIIGPQGAALLSYNAGVSFVQDSAHGILPTTLDVSWNGSQLSITENGNLDSRIMMNIPNRNYFVVSFHDVS